MYICPICFCTLRSKQSTYADLPQPTQVHVCTQSPSLLVQLQAAGVYVLQDARHLPPRFLLPEGRRRLRRRRRSSNVNGGFVFFAAPTPSFSFLPPSPFGREFDLAPSKLGGRRGREGGRGLAVRRRFLPLLPLPLFPLRAALCSP